MESLQNDNQPEQINPPAKKSRSTPAARIPVRLHRNVSLIRTHDAHLAEELLARKKLAGLLAGRLNGEILLVRPGQENAVLEELRKIGQAAQVFRGTLQP